MKKSLMIVKQGIEFIKELVFVVLVVLLFTTFIVSHNKIPTQSMVSTINIGDHILTTMIPYYYRNPKRGEIVVFKQGTEKWVKRVIGLPGDEIDIRDGEVYVNNEKIDESAYIMEGASSAPYEGMNPVSFPYRVPEEHYFLMGDNREESKDCRYIGAVSRDNIYGKAWVKIFPFDEIGILK